MTPTEEAQRLLDAATPGECYVNGPDAIALAAVPTDTTKKD